MSSLRRNLTASFFALMFCNVSHANEILLNFADGLLPSAKGWTFQGQDQGGGPLLESQAATVSGGILHLDTFALGGAGSTNVLAYWTMPTANFDQANYNYEIRMRVDAPNSFRSCQGGLLGAGIGVQGDFVSEITVMRPQLDVEGFAAAGSSDTCFLLPIDASVFHTYSLEVRNDIQAKFFIDGIQIAEGEMNIANVNPRETLFGDLSTSGGDVTVDIMSLKVSDIPEPSSTLLLSVGLIASIFTFRIRSGRASLA